MGNARMLATLFWSLLGIRSKSGHTRDLKDLSFTKVVLLAVLGIFLFVGLILVAVNLVTSIS